MRCCKVAHCLVTSGPCLPGVLGLEVPFPLRVRAPVVVVVVAGMWVAGMMFLLSEVVQVPAVRLGMMVVAGLTLTLRRLLRWTRR